MDLSNLATVICPSLIYARGRDAARDESFGAIRVVEALLQNQDQFFTVPEEFLPILHDQEYFSSNLELPSKDFMKKCDTYMRLKSNGRQLPSSNSNSSQARFAAPNSPNPDRSFTGPSPSVRPSLPPSQSSSSSPAMPQGIATAQVQPPPRTDEWPTSPGLGNSSNVIPPSSRPISYAPPRPSGEYPTTVVSNG